MASRILRATVRSLVRKTVFTYCWVIVDPPCWDTLLAGELGPPGPGDAGGVHAVVVPEVLVLGGDDGVDQDPRDPPVRDDDPVLLAAELGRGVVGAAALGDLAGADERGLGQRGALRAAARRWTGPARRRPARRRPRAWPGRAAGASARRCCGDGSGGGGSGPRGRGARRVDVRGVVGGGVRRHAGEDPARRGRADRARLPFDYGTVRVRVGQRSKTRLRWFQPQPGQTSTT